MKQVSLIVAAGLFFLASASTTSGVLAQTSTPQPSASLARPQRPMGGLQIDVEPRRALVFVDGFPVGRVDDFRGYYHHLAILPAGSHFVEVLESGYWPLTFGVTILPGRTLKYSGQLQEASGSDF